MIEFSGSTLLLDIEGTTSSVSFVYDVMFPFVRREIALFLRDHGREKEVRRACAKIASEAKTSAASAENIPGLSAAGADHLAMSEFVEREVLRLMDADIKSTGLKELQGLVWRRGFESGEMQAHVFDDFPPALRAWQAARRRLAIYSSGSVQAQHLFFRHTIVGDLLDFFSAHFDTQIGPKKEAQSYRLISAALNTDPQDVLFLSDIVVELDAAQAVGFQTALSRRPGNAPIPPGHGHPEFADFSEILLTK